MSTFCFAMDRMFWDPFMVCFGLFTVIAPMSLFIYLFIVKQHILLIMYFHLLSCCSCCYFVKITAFSFRFFFSCFSCYLVAKKIGENNRKMAGCLPHGWDLLSQLD